MDSETHPKEDFTLPELDFSEPPPGSDRRAFMIQSAMAAAIVAVGGRASPLFGQVPATAPLGSKPPDPDLNVMQKSKGPVMTLIDEFYKVGPGPSSSHTIGPMRITYDFYQRATKLPAAQLDQATALKVHLFGSLSATGKGHGTERAALAGLIGHEPATIDPAILDNMAANPDKTYPVKLGSKTINVSLKDIIYDATKGDFPHANTMTAKLMAGDSTAPISEIRFIIPNAAPIRAAFGTRSAASACHIGWSALKNRLVTKSRPPSAHSALPPADR
jgi:L-serine dehydratase